MWSNNPRHHHLSKFGRFLLVGLLRVLGTVVQRCVGWTMGPPSRLVSKETALHRTSRCTYHWIHFANLCFRY